MTSSEPSDLQATILHPETRRSLLAFARTFLRNSADAEDVVQEALLSATRGANTFESRGSTLRWLRQIVLNAGRMQRRARGRTRRGGKAVHLSLDDVPEPAQWQTPERAFLTKEALSLVALQLESVPPFDRDLVFRFALDEVSLDRLASDAKITRAAAKSRMFRVRRALSSVTASEPCAG